MKLPQIKNKIGFADGILLTALLLTGSFHEYVSCVLSVVMCIWLLLQLERGSVFVFRKSLLAIAVTVVVAAYGLTCIWAIDRGMAFIGFLKFLPAFLYCLCLWQRQGQGILSWLPYCGAALTVFGALMSLIPDISGYFLVAGRFAGIFQYPNTYAVFLLVCQLLLCKKMRWTLPNILTLVILVAGLLYTGSRTVFVVFLVANAALFAIGGKNNRMLLAGAAGVLVLAAIGVLLWGKGTILYRYLTISITESTFVGRLLYMADALKLLVQYPFGMGYMGYYYAQTEIQTGVYSVMFVHNDFLQFMLDVGVLPGGLLVAALARWFFRKDIEGGDKIIVGALCLHSLFDFNLQFVGMLMLLLLMMDRSDQNWSYTIKKPLPLQLTAAALGLVSLYMGISLGFAYFEQRELAEKLYPYDTQNNLVMLSRTEDLSRANELSDRILAQNTHHYAPYGMKAKYAYSQGKFAELILNKQSVFEQNPFGYEEYEEYCYMLIAATSLYQQRGDTESAQVCIQQLRDTKARLEAVTDRLSFLGSMIKDQPETVLPEDILEYISKMEEGKE